MKVPPQLIMDIVVNLSNTKHPTLIKLLNCLVKSDEGPLKRNQQLVVKALLQYKQSIEIVMDTTPEEKLKIMSGGDIGNVNSKAKVLPTTGNAISSNSNNKSNVESQCYIANIVQLLAYCSKGDNKAVESICQTMFTLQELLNIILLPDLCNGLRGPFVQFLIAVFIASDLERSDFELKAGSPELFFFLYSLGHCVIFPFDGIRPRAQDVDLYRRSESDVDEVSRSGQL